MSFVFALDFALDFAFALALAFASVLDFALIVLLLSWDAFLYVRLGKPLMLAAAKKKELIIR